MTDNEIAKHIYEKNGFEQDENPLYIAMRLKGGDDNASRNSVDCP